MKTQTGLEILCGQPDKWLKKERVGLVTHPAAILPDYTASQEALFSAGINLKAFFGPEHGFYGHAEDARAVEDSRDQHLGLPVYSLYGDHLEPTSEMLAELDVLIFDMQDVGVRFYTYLSTLYYVLKAAGKYGKKVLVLDRPNPLSGRVLPGPVCESGLLSFIGITALPVQHGMTMGELALLMNSRHAFDADVCVVPMQGWKRDMWFEQTGLDWVPTSPAMPHLSTTILYPCTCFMEGLNLSEGRGTALPFEIIGAPWLDGVHLAKNMNLLGLPGIFFRPFSFFPTDGKCSRQVCYGVQLHVRDRNVFQPLETLLNLIKEIYRLPGNQLTFLENSWEGEYPHFDLLMGTAEVRFALQAGLGFREFKNKWEEECSKFESLRRPFLLYS